MWCSKLKVENQILEKKRGGGGGQDNEIINIQK